MSSIARAFGSIAVCAALYGVPVGSIALDGAAPNPIAVSRDTSLDIVVSRIDDALIVDWRPLRDVPSDAVTFTAALDGRVVAPSAHEPFARGGRTASLVLIDGAGGEPRAAAVRKAKRDALVLALAAGRDDRLAYGVFGLTLRLIAPEATDAAALPRALFAEPPFDEKHDLSGALVAALRGLESQSAERKAVFVFTGGYDDGTLPLRAVARLAEQDDVTLSFVMESPDRDRLPFALAALAARTGGRLVGEDEVTRFLAAPLAQLRAGGRLRFDLRELRRAWWSDRSVFELVATIGGEPRTLRLPLDLPASGPIDSVAAAAVDHPTAGVGAIAIGLGLFAAATAFVRVRHRRARSTPSKHVGVLPLVLLQDAVSGLAHVLREGDTTIGRASDNDIVVNDPFVSRRHVVISRRDGTIVLSNLSAVNGTRVNGAPLMEAGLAHGDLVTIGEVHLRVVAAGASLCRSDPRSPEEVSCS